MYFWYAISLISCLLNDCVLGSLPFVPVCVCLFGVLFNVSTSWCVFSFILLPFFHAIVSIFRNNFFPSYNYWTNGVLFNWVVFRFSAFILAVVVVDVFSSVSIFNKIANQGISVKNVWNYYYCIARSANEVYEIPAHFLFLSVYFFQFLRYFRGACEQFTLHTKFNKINVTH